MGLKRLDNISIIVEDMETMVAFFEELGLKVEGKTIVEGEWVGRVIALGDVKAEIVMMRTPDGHGCLELSRFIRPDAIKTTPEVAPANALGIRRIMFAVDNVDETLAKLQKKGGELMAHVEQFEDTYRLCYVRGPEGIMIALAEEMK